MRREEGSHQKEPWADQNTSVVKTRENGSNLGINWFEDQRNEIYQTVVDYVRSLKYHAIDQNDKIRRWLIQGEHEALRCPLNKPDAFRLIAEVFNKCQSRIGQTRQTNLPANSLFLAKELPRWIGSPPRARKADERIQQIKWKHPASLGRDAKAAWGSSQRNRQGWPCWFWIHQWKYERDEVHLKLSGFIAVWYLEWDQWQDSLWREFNVNARIVERWWKIFEYWYYEEWCFEGYGTWWECR